MPQPHETPPSSEHPGRPGRPTPVGRLIAAASAAVSLVAAFSIGVIAILEIGRATEADPAALAAVLSAVWVGGVGTVGFVLATRRPENRVSWLFVALAPLLAFIALVWLGRWTPPPAVAYPFEWLSLVGSWVAVMLSGPVLALVFPSGRLPSPRWRLPVALAATIFGLGLILLHSVPGAIAELAGPDIPVAADPDAGIPALTPWADALAMLMYGGVFGLGILGIAAVVQRRRTGDAVTRAQLRWFLLAIALIPLGLGVSMLESVLQADGTAIVGPTILFCGFGLTPVAVAIAILRYRLFDIDVVIRRTLTYTLLVAILGSVYVGSIVILQSAVSAQTGGQGVAVAASTLLVAAAFQPLRRRVQAAVDRRFNRSGTDAATIVDWFGVRLRGQLELDAIALDLQRASDAALRPRTLSIWIRPALGRNDFGTLARKDWHR